MKIGHYCSFIDDLIRTVPSYSYTGILMFCDIYEERPKIIKGTKVCFLAILSIADLLQMMNGFHISIPHGCPLFIFEETLNEK